MTMETAVNSNQTRDKIQKYLTFMLGNESYGLEIHKVREIVALRHITPVPRTQPFIRGVTNLRGHVIPVMDLRAKLGLPETEPNELTCIIVVESQNFDIGLIVDRVCDVLNISANESEDPPAFGMELETDFLMGIGKADGRVTMLLDLDKVLNGDEAECIRQNQPHPAN
ncbi:MAG: chemotaxis protein CheW [Thermoguttaceae bacterium]